MSGDENDVGMENRITIALSHLIYFNLTEGFCSRSRSAIISDEETLNQTAALPHSSLFDLIRRAASFRSSIKQPHSSRSGKATLQVSPLSTSPLRQRNEGIRYTGTIKCLTTSQKLLNRKDIIK
jgi:hypothetical protein